MHKQEKGKEGGQAKYAQVTSGAEPMIKRQIVSLILTFTTVHLVVRDVVVLLQFKTQ